MNRWAGERQAADLNPTDTDRILFEEIAWKTFNGNAPHLIAALTLRIAGKVVGIKAPHRLALSDEARAGAIK